MNHIAEVDAFSFAKLSCSSIPDLLDDNDKLTPSQQINLLRRKLQITDASCFHQHSSFFNNKFLQRRENNQQSHHTPHSTYPKLVVQASTNIPRNKSYWLTRVENGNCWRDDFYPLWIGCRSIQPTTCKRLEWHYQQLLMNENYLDENCQSHTYSMLLRESISRTTSHDGGLQCWYIAFSWNEELEVIFDHV